MGHKGIGFVYLAAGILLALQPTLAGAATCDELNQAWSSKLYKDFKVDWSLETFNCGSTASSIAQGMYDLANTTFKPNNDNFAPDFYSWATGLIKQTVYQETDEGRAWAIASAGSSGTMTIYGGFATQDPDWQAATLVHEARHIQSDDPGHVNCAAGSNEGKEACDDQLFDDQGWSGSGYNYTFRYLWWVRDAANETELDRDLAGSLMKSMITANFNNVTNEQVQKWGD